MRMLRAVTGEPTSRSMSAGESLANPLGIVKPDCLAGGLDALAVFGPLAQGGDGIFMRRPLARAIMTRFAAAAALRKGIPLQQRRPILRTADKYIYRETKL